MPRRSGDPTRGRGPRPKGGRGHRGHGRRRMESEPPELIDPSEQETGSEGDGESCW
jgi:hypothetical protein